MYSLFKVRKSETVPAKEVLALRCEAEILTGILIHLSMKVSEQTNNLFFVVETSFVNKGLKMGIRLENLLTRIVLFLFGS